MSSKTSNFIERLVNGFESSSFVVIVHSVAVPSQNLIQSFLKNDCNHSKSCFVLLNHCKAAFDHVIDNGLQVFNYYENHARQANAAHFRSFFDEINHEFQYNTVFIDCLTPLFAFESNSNVCELLLKLKANNRRVVCALNKDCVSELNIESIKQVATTIINLASFINKRYIANIIHKKPNSRTEFSIVYTDECFSIESGFKIKYYKLDEKENQVFEAKPVDEFIGTLPFNLNLKDNERQAKDKLILPYTKLQEPSNASKVYYDPDKDDDIDEEDPDDDLDI